MAKAVKAHYRDIEIQADELNKATSGLRPVSPDGLPYIGKTSKYQNLTIAAGHAMMGWSLGPVTGKLVAQEIAKEKTMVNLELFSPDRFK